MYPHCAGSSGPRPENPPVLCMVLWQPPPSHANNESASASKHAPSLVALTRYFKSMSVDHRGPSTPHPTCTAAAGCHHVSNAPPHTDPGGGPTGPGSTGDGWRVAPFTLTTSRGAVAGHDALGPRTLSTEHIPQRTPQRTPQHTPAHPSAPLSTPLSTELLHALGNRGSRSGGRGSSSALGGGGYRPGTSSGKEGANSDGDGGGGEWCQMSVDGGAVAIEAHFPGGLGGSLSVRCVQLGV